MTLPDPTCRKPTQEFLILCVLVKYTGLTLTQELIDTMHKDFINEMRNGNCSWAFEETP